MVKTQENLLPSCHQVAHMSRSETLAVTLTTSQRGHEEEKDRRGRQISDKAITVFRLRSGHRRQPVQLIWWLQLWWYDKKRYICNCCQPRWASIRKGIERHSLDRAAKIFLRKRNSLFLRGKRLFEDKKPITEGCCQN